MIPSLELVSIAFGKLHSGSIDLQPSRGTGTRLTGPEAAARYMGIVKAVNNLPAPSRDWAIFAYVDGLDIRGIDTRWQTAGRIVMHVMQNVKWEQPKSWEGDDNKPAQKVAVVKHIVDSVYRHKPVINQDLAAIAGLGASQGFAPSKTWGQYRQAVNVVFDGWDADILEAVARALEGRAA